MGKKKGRKQMVVSSAGDLDSFVNKKDPESPKGGAKDAAAASEAVSGAAGSSEPSEVTHTSESKIKAAIMKIRKDPQRFSLKDLADHFLYLDNKLIDAYCNTGDESDFNPKERPEILEDEAFLFYIRQLC